MLETSKSYDGNNYTFLELSKVLMNRADVIGEQ